MNLNKFREKVRHSPRIRASQKRTSTGLYNVCKNHHKTGSTWRYQYRTRDGEIKSLYCVDLSGLKERVIKERLPWIIVDENKAKNTFKEDGGIL